MPAPADQPPPPEAPAQPEARVPRWLWALLVLAPLLAYASALQNGFVSDDNPVIRDGRLIGSLRNLPKLFLHDALFNSLHGEALAAGMMVDTYRPLPLATFFVEHALFGLWPLPYHATSVLLHALNVLLLFLVGRRLSLPLPAAALAALLFAVHPSLCEAVHWVNGRSDPLCVLFFLLIVLLYSRVALSAEPPRRAARALRLLAIGLCALCATLCKETAFVLLPTLLLPALWRSAGARARALAGLAPLFLGLAVGMGCRLLVLHRTAAYPSGTSLGFLLRRVLPLWRDGVVSLLLPAARLQPSLFEAYHDVGAAALLGSALLLLVVLAAAAACLWWGRADLTRAPAAPSQADLFPWALSAFLVTTAPVVLLTIEEGWSGWGRYLYPSAPLWCLALAALCARLAPRAPQTLQPRLPWLAALPLAAMAVVTFLAGPAWRDERAVAEAQISERPDISVGYSLLAVVEFNEGHAERALALLQQALERAPYQAKSWSRAAFVLLRLKRRDAALLHAERALLLSPREAEARYVKAVVLVQRGGPGDDATAAHLIGEQLRDTPEDPRFWKVIQGVLRDGGAATPFAQALQREPLGPTATARLRTELSKARPAPVQP